MLGFAAPFDRSVASLGFSHAAAQLSQLIAGELVMGRGEKKRGLANRHLDQLAPVVRGVRSVRLQHVVARKLRHHPLVVDER